ncbi:MAG: TlyA family rRNA (cytidine-2'-O)-methyltransferase [Phycisphaerales bacterium]|nr:TlyA family rRNA (cytidine-2'-O)-methyltransferase [Phycisphaerales bacterium]
MSEERPYVGRGALKLEHALGAFALDVRGLTCADFGCNVGGFTDLLLRRGVRRVFAVDTGYGALAWSLRNDGRVTVMERTNALHAEPPPETIDLVVIDMGWTPQRLAVPAALRWLTPEPHGRIITLIKPHYEVDKEDAKSLLVKGVLPDDMAERIAEQAAARAGEWGARLLGLTRSPIRGGAGKGNKEGNLEWLALLGRA